MDPLEPVAVRVLGALIEKEYATPDNYPLTLKSLIAACNQTSNRKPVMTLDETEVLRGLDALKRRSWARDVHHGSARVVRYREQIGETLHLHQPELAILSVLLLRGPQTVGEIKSRTNRLAEFIDLKHVEITLEALSDLSTPLVVALPRRPGQKEMRWAHLLGGTPDVADEPSRPARSAGSGRLPGSPPAVESPQATKSPEAARAASPGGAGDRIGSLEAEVASLRQEVASLREELHAFQRLFE